MIVTEFYAERYDGVRLVRSYSSEGKCITRDGEIYEEAIDPEELGRVYEETDIPISGNGQDWDDGGDEPGESRTDINAGQA